MEACREEGPRPRGGAVKAPVLKVLAWAGALLFCVIAVIIVVVSYSRSQRWEAMRRRTAELREESARRDARRPVMEGAPEPGEAWDEYAKALAETARFKSDMGKLGEFVVRGKKADRAWVVALVGRHKAALDHLRNGARREQGRYPYDWSSGWSMKTPSLLESQLLANLTASAARLEAEAGRPVEAASLLFDLCQFARDLGHDAPLISEMIAISIYGVALDELRDLVLSGSLAPGEWKEVARRLEIVDRSFPSHGVCLLNERLASGIEVEKGGLSWEAMGKTSFGVGLTGWRFGFSMDSMGVNAMDLLDQAMRAGAEAEGKDWAEAERVAADSNARVSGSGNPVAQMIIPGLLQSGRAVRERRAHVRLLRAAAMWKAGEPVPELEDPFGTKLLHSVTGGRLKVWSVGRDGVDSGGKGEWRPNGHDIVLEVER